MTRVEFLALVCQYGGSLIAMTEESYQTGPGGQFVDLHARDAQARLDMIMKEWDRLHIAAQAHSADRDAGS